MKSSIGSSGAVYFLVNRSPGVAPFVSVSAASFQVGPVAPDSIVAAFGTGLASATEAASANPLPETLAGTSVQVRDASGVERNAGLFAVSPGQVNFLVPAATAAGGTTVTIAGGTGSKSAGIEVSRVSPGLFQANADGLAAAQVVRVDGANQTLEDVVMLDTAGKVVPRPIEFGGIQQQLILLLYGTGFRLRGALTDVRVTVAGLTMPVAYAGPQSLFPGLDQVNVTLARGLAGRGLVEVKLTVEGKDANTVKIQFK